jgi:hypothetical protein
VCLRVHRFPGCRLAKLDKVRDCAELSFGPNVGDVATDLRSSRRCPGFQALRFRPQDPSLMENGCDLPF